MREKPQVSVIIPAYESHFTIEGCLRALRQQSFSDFEVLIIDSSPTSRVEDIVRSYSPEVRYERSAQRLRPHAARDYGAQLARGDLFVFTDPDVYAQSEWLEKMVAAHRATGRVIVGGVACFGRQWLDIGMHLCKFDIWLPGGEPRSIDLAPAVNMLCPREVFVEMEGFPGSLMSGDTLFSWRLKERGGKMWFVPEALVYHHHLSTWREFLNERYQRGGEFARLRMDWGAWKAARILLFLVASALPFRLVKILGRAATNALRAGQGLDYVLTFPVLVAGQAAWLAGEAVVYLQSLTRRN